MKACEPRDLLDRVTDICLFEGRALEVNPKLIDVAWRNYFGTSHGFSTQAAPRQTGELVLDDPLQV
jgi:surface antigen